MSQAKASSDPALSCAIKAVSSARIPIALARLPKAVPACMENSSYSSRENAQLASARSKRGRWSGGRRFGGGLLLFPDGRGRCRAIVDNGRLLRSYRRLYGGCGVQGSLELNNLCFAVLRSPQNRVAKLRSGCLKFLERGIERIRLVLRSGQH